MATKRTKLSERKLNDGKYAVRCREATLFGAAANGHSQIWPDSVMVIQGDRASFYRNGKKLWDCNTEYAVAHFDISPLADR